MLLSPLTLVYWALVWNVARLFVQYHLTWIESVKYTVILILCVSFYKDITNRLSILKCNVIYKTQSFLPLPACCDVFGTAAAPSTW